jgi:hypothetical protein
MSAGTEANKSFHVLFQNVISYLNDNKIKYAILRGYEDLPNARINDIDFAIETKEHLYYLLKYLNDKGVKIQLTKERFGVKMYSFFWMNTTVKYDFWYDINYLGLSYCNMDLLFKTRVFGDERGFHHVSLKSEFFISILKEMLHNKTLRSDKIKRLQEISPVNPEWENVLSKKTSSKFSVMASVNRYEPELRIIALREMVLNNFRSYGLGVLVRITYWFVVRIRTGFGKWNK